MTSKQRVDQAEAVQQPARLAIVVEFDQRTGRVWVKGNILANQIVAAGMLMKALMLVVGEKPPTQDLGLEIVRGASLAREN